ncbi:CYFA0S23e00804g1_1 [Cyberlindnera fabianii]|uniref:CYFA0S23e00804g1_1 n=1 Tax=Cyberlindnera fabianii TaxID=36022 RepID=A0A061BHF9_CYBFA|nr:CYFA0S23e00804g1_1 [Cyberlindnera fabianii]
MSRRKAQPIVMNKEDGFFREAVSLYESKQYKKSLKLCDQVLKKNGNHVEALSLKALVLYFLKEPKESELYVKKAQDRNSSSPFVFHILGILRRNQLRYADAAKLFKASLDNGSQNNVIWRDLSTMETQERDYRALVHSRHQYLNSAPGFRANWTSLAVAYHLFGDYNAAERTLHKFEELAKDKISEAEMYEHSELQLYKNEMIGAQDVERALKDLGTLDTFDKLAELEMEADYLMKLDRKNDAQKVYRQLLKRNPDNVKYYHLLEKALGTTKKSEKYRDQLYAKLVKFYPRSDPPRYIPLTFTTGDLFKERAKDYILSQLKRGVPATFTNVKPLYKDSTKVAIIEEIVEDFYASEAKTVSPLCWVWTTYFLAQHYLHLSNLNKARDLIEAAVKHTPTLVELYILKARIYKHLGDLSGAAEIMNEGRLIDLQDRFINSKCVKYYMRANNIEEAVKVVSLFTKNDNAANGVKDLHMMQASWFIIDSAESYARLYEEASAKGDTDEATKFAGLALKRFYGIVKVFEEYWHDQVDFHTFCMRKGTVRAYVDMLKWEDKVFASPVYCRAVEGAAKIYFKLDAEQATAPAEDEEGITHKDLKKAKKEKAAKQKALDAEKPNVLAYADDSDVFGETLIGDLTKFDELFFQHLWKQDQDKIITNEIQYQLQFKLKKIALAVAALARLKKQTNDSYVYIPAHVLELKYKTDAGITKMLAEKGIEKNFDVDFEKIEEFIDKYCSTETFEGVQGLAAVAKLQLSEIDNDGLKQKILEAAKALEPLQQFSVLSQL